MIGQLGGPDLPTNDSGHPDVSVIVVTWDARDELAKVLACLAAQTVASHVIVVDNGSRDGSVELVRERFPAVELIELPRNEGFAGPNNLGLQHAKAPWILTLNNDVTFDPDFVETLLAAAQDAPADVFALGAALVYADRPDTVQTLGTRPLPNGNGVNVGKNEPLADHLEPEEIFGPCAGAALYRRSVIDEIGFFDARYFAYLEDADLAFRARKAGYRAYTVPSAVARHVHSHTAGRMPFVKLGLIERNRLLNLVKHFPRRALWVEPFVTASILVRYRFTPARAQVSADQETYFDRRNLLKVARIMVSARWYVLRHAREFRRIPWVP